MAAVVRSLEISGEELLRSDGCLYINTVLSKSTAPHGQGIALSPYWSEPSGYSTTLHMGHQWDGGRARTNRGSEHPPVEVPNMRRCVSTAGVLESTDCAD